VADDRDVLLAEGFLLVAVLPGVVLAAADGLRLAGCQEGVFLVEAISHGGGSGGEPTGASSGALAS